MSTVSLPGLISAAPEPVVGVASKKSAVDPASSNSFGTALNKALPSKPEATNPVSADKSPAAELSKGVAESPIQEPTPPLVADPEKAGDSKPLIEPVKPEAPTIGDDTDTAPEVDGPVVSVEPMTPQQNTIPEGLMVNQPLQMAGHTQSETAKDFKPADNSVGSSVLASIQMSKKMDNQKAALIPQGKDAPRDIATVAAEVKQGMQGKEQLHGAIANPFAAEAKVESKSSPRSAPPVAPTVEPTAQSTSVQAPPASSDQKASSSPVELGTSSLSTAGNVTSQSHTQAQVLIQPTAPANLTAQVATQEWNKGFGQQIVNMHLRGDQTMELNLHPQDLGPISITLKVSDASQAHAQFFSHNAQVRSAIEQALPQLKEAMAEQGISLGQTSVGDQRQQQSYRDTESQAVSSRDMSDSLKLTEVSSEKSTVNQQVDGQISTYA